jgi:hypothetical protein
VVDFTAFYAVIRMVATSIGGFSVVLLHYCLLGAVKLIRMILNSKDFLKQTCLIVIICNKVSYNINETDETKMRQTTISKSVS